MTFVMKMFARVLLGKGSGCSHNIKRVMDSLIFF